MVQFGDHLWLGIICGLGTICGAVQVTVLSIGNLATQFPPRSKAHSG